MTQYQTLAPDQTPVRDGTIKLHGQEGFEGMRAAGRLAGTILDELTTMVEPGVTTEAIDDAVRSMMLDAGAVPATLGYRGYEHSCCTSVNHVVCHGIPAGKPLKNGDIVNIDVTPILDGWHGDTSRMYLVGDVSLKASRLVEVTHECMMAGIAAVRPGARLGDIGAAIEAHARQHRYGVVREFCGHGLGPTVPRFARSGPRRAGRDGAGAARGHVLHRRADDQCRPPAFQGAARRLDRGDARQVAIRPVRAFDRRHGGWRGDIHRLAQKGSTSRLTSAGHRVRRRQRRIGVAFGFGR